MPAHGDQHRVSSTVANPFEETKPHINEYTAQEIATLQSRLEKQLGPEYISSRPGASGQKVHYIAGEKCINLANEVFGFNGWSSSIQNIQVDFADELPNGKFSLGLSVIVRVTLRDGTYHEDVGYGLIENAKGKATAFEKCKKEGTTDALKRALRNFGNVLGNCIYDKDYLAKITKVKVTSSKWDVENLHRHADFAPIKKENAMGETVYHKPNGVTNVPSGAELEDEFGGDEFDEVDFSESHSGNSANPDEVVLEATLPSEHFYGHAGPDRLGRSNSIGKGAQALQQNSRHSIAPDFSSLAVVQSPNGVRLRHPGPNIERSHILAHNPQTPTNARVAHNMTQPGQMPPPQHEPNGGPRPPQQPINPPQDSNVLLNSNPMPLPAPQAFAQRQQQKLENKSNGGSTPPSVLPPGHEPPSGFFTARAAESLQNPGAVPADVPLFNPKTESPSIRKTSGVDHSKSVPVKREIVTGAPSPSTNHAAVVGRANIVNPQAEVGRRIGMPGAAAASPLGNRSSYKPLQMKRLAEVDPAIPQRPPLGDLTAQLNVPTDGGGDIKRPRLGEA
ncbi:MAG: DNA repair protein rad52 [Pycnora praestabilis]|nr:MAG: DNA repair protein rad52 [Pycnora praestabilis]